MMHRLQLTALAVCLLVTLPLTARPISGQAGEAVVGGVAGLAAGGWWTLSITSARARGGDVLFTPSDARGTAIVMGAIGTAAGVAGGLWAEEQMPDALLGAAIGWASGFGLGFLVGDAIWEDEGGKWAGAVIAAGVGLAIGAVIGGLTAHEEDPLPGGSSLRAHHPGRALTFQHSFPVGR